MKISVIVPTLDEEARIAARLEELSVIDDLHEILVVDGGSRDATVGIARSFPRALVLASPRGRARQMNRGATAAVGDVLLFLHADVSLPAYAAASIREALRDPRVVAGAFRTRTIGDSRKTWLRPFLRLADLRSRYTSLPYGDQALFVLADVFRQAGGFPEIPLMEDLELSRRLRRLGRIRTVRDCVRVSGRRFESRPIYYAFLMNVLPLLYRLGVPPAWLARTYGRPR